MNTTQAETIRQFLALTPETIHVGRQTFTRGVTLTGDGNQCIFAWGSKRKGAILTDKLVATVDYCNASDTYRLSVASFNGETFATRPLMDVDGATFEAFRNVEAIIVAESACPRCDDLTISAWVR